MILPRYNYYIGVNDPNLFFENGVSISPDGEFVQTGSEDYICEGLIKNGIQGLFFSAALSVGYIYFYTITRQFISRTALNAVQNLVAAVPEGAVHFAISFSTLDPNFKVRKDNAEFIYYIKSVNPHFKELSKKYSKENNQEFFRNSLDGQIKLFGDDYNFVKSADIESNLVFIIEKYNRHVNTWINYYKGTFNKTDCKFDYGKRKCELKTTTLDEYTEILNKYEDTYNLIKLAPELSRISIHKRPLIQVYIKGSNSVTNLFGGIYWEDEVTDAVDSHEDLIRKYYFSYAEVANEFYIKGAAIPDVNGVYAGINGNWSNKTGYECYVGDDIIDGASYLFIRKVGASTATYISEQRWIFNDRDKISLGAHMKGAVFHAFGNAQDKCTIETLFEYCIYQRILCNSETLTDSSGKKDTYNLPYDDFAAERQNYKRCIGLSNGLFFCTSKVVDKPTKYGMNDDKKYFTDEFIPMITGLSRPLPISKNSWANASLWYVYDNAYKFFDKSLQKQYYLKDSCSIGNAIKVILKEIDPTITHEPTAEYSQFLYGETNPLGIARFYVHITQKTNILKGNYDQAAQKAEISLQSIMNMLQNCFRCYWYIENNKLKIEHISFFMNGGSYTKKDNYQLDFTKLKDAFNKKPSDFMQTEIEFDKSNLARRYEFGWADEVTDLFGNITVDVESKYIQRDKTEQISANDFSSDVDYMQFEPSKFNNDGFALLCPVKNNNGELELPIIEVDNLIDDTNRMYTAIIQNWYASWIYLQLLYMYDMPAENVKSNALQYLYVHDIKRCMKNDITFPAEDDLEILPLIKTSIGNGKIDEMSFNLVTRQAKIKLLYRPQ